MKQEDRDDFATVRSHAASKIAYDLSKATAQACLLINGGAATAVIAFLAKEHIEPAVARSVPWSLAGYAVGVLSSAVMLFCELMNADYWNYSWYHITYEHDRAKATDWENKANRWHVGFYCAFAVAIASFFFASGWMVHPLM